MPGSAKAPAAYLRNLFNGVLAKMPTQARVSATETVAMLSTRNLTIISPNGIFFANLIHLEQRDRLERNEILEIFVQREDAQRMGR